MWILNERHLSLYLLLNSFLQCPQRRTVRLTESMRLLYNKNLVFWHCVVCYMSLSGHWHWIMDILFNKFMIYPCGYLRSSKLCCYISLSALNYLCKGFLKEKQGILYCNWSLLEYNIPRKLFIISAHM
jgi:hypothetical protein